MSLIGLLPPELIGLVVEFVEPKTLPALRLASQTLCHHATPFLFRHMDFWLEKRSLRKLVNIARIPHLAKHVKHISCGTEEFYDVDFEMFKRHVYRDNRDPGAEYDEHQHRASYRVYNRYARRQKSLRDKGTDVYLLTVALASFTALQSMEISDHFCASVENGGNPPKLLEHEPLLLPQMLMPTNILTPRGGNQLRTVLKAIVVAGTILRSFSITLYEGNVSRFGGFLSPLDLGEKRLAQAAFMNLKEFSLVLPEMVSSAYERISGDELSVTTILRASENLEYLCLELSGIDCDDPAPGASFQDLFGTCRFTRLHELMIEDLIVSESEFSDFLLRSCPELRGLYLDSARLTRGSWGSLFQKIRRFSCLDTVGLAHLRFDYAEGCFFTMLDRCQDTGALYDYLCTRSHHDPWPQMVKKQREILDEEDRLDGEEDSLRYQDCTELPPE